tara:strand:+ start:371 stop:625 length:255 start_codon:yes stop_codon:yes gene_type:complete
MDMIILIELISLFHTTDRAKPFTSVGLLNKVINKASSRGLTTKPSQVAYVVAKQDPMLMSKSVALETFVEPMKVTAIYLGYVVI